MTTPAADAAKTPEAPKWYDNKTVLTVSAITGLVLGMLSLGVIMAAMGTSPNWYYCGGDFPKFSPDLPHATEIEQTCQYGAQVGAVALAPCILGFVIFVISSVALYRKMKQESTEVKPELLKNIAMVAGIAIAAFSAGLVIGSSTILHNGVSRMEDLIAQGRHDNPKASVKDYSDEWTDEYGNKWNTKWFVLWDRLQANWVDPTKSAMSGILSAGVFGAIGGGSLFAFGLLGRGAFSCITRIKEKKEAATQQ